LRGERRVRSLTKKKGERLMRSLKTKRGRKKNKLMEETKNE